MPTSRQYPPEVMHFELTEDHIKLLRHADVGWNPCEYGAPAIDCKRPYGNSFVAGDIAEILGWSVPDPDGDDAWLPTWYSTRRGASEQGRS